MPVPPIPQRPRLRPVEAAKFEHEGEVLFQLQDPTGLAQGAVALSTSGYVITRLFNGRNTVADMQSALLRELGLVVPWEPIHGLIASLDEARLLESESFRRFWDGLPARPPLRLTMQDEAGANAKLIGGMVAAGGDGAPAGRVVGLIAPHLDYERGAPCYADAYKVLAERNTAGRFIILGTNHFHASFELTATGKDFRTPLGTARNDRAFLKRLQERMGVDLCRHEFAHIREHSVELQVRVLQHLLGTDDFTFVPFLCPDPCQPVPGYDAWAESDRFAAALRAEIDADPTPTCVIAGADLAHIGRHFGDADELGDAWLGRIGEQDKTLLSHVDGARPAAFLAHLKSDENARRVCSAGCISTLMKTMQGRARPQVLRYHQAVTREAQTAVTCCAAVYTE